ncbi:MAG: ribosomal L7Ae/L30e/S12e/Gadd45 family protein [Erysipelotrichaceae bacterium]|nr:ribosomal L7Ae/L30e/S12e/Gadd45 family protein [Erysipelotrichaceae bacterium]MBQ5443614.1 ribosomal L7Ae/L30e/S12e/Gadd45 family protein [Erysipelotrichaceae bacterium]
MADKLNTLGLAYRARKAVLGEEVLNRIDKIKLMFIASDISEKSRERYEKKCHYYKIDRIDEYSGEQLSSALGKNNVKVVGILDKGFKDALLKNK